MRWDFHAIKDYVAVSEKDYTMPLLKKEIDEIERKVDMVHVKVEMDIIDSGAGVATIIMLKDTVNQIEELVDTVRDSSDLIRIIAL